MDSLDECIDRLVQVIDAKIGEKFAVIDFAELATFFTLDVITERGYGKTFGYLSSQTDLYHYIKVIENSVAFMTLASNWPRLRSLVSKSLEWPIARTFIYKLCGLEELVRAVDQQVENEFSDLPSQNTVRSPEKATMLQLFKEKGMTKEQAKVEALFLLTAGSHSTATAIRMIMLHVITSPHIMGRLRQELHKNSEGCEYLNACVKEGLRIFPPFPGLLMKERISKTKASNSDKRDVDSKVQDVNSNIRNLPLGVEIGYNIVGVQRNPKIFENPEVFDPDRWLISDPGKHHEMDAALNLVFGQRGSWGCLGQKMAFQEISQVLLEVMFDLCKFMNCMLTRDLAAIQTL
ncbi:cytochrome P450, putative [Talaromyces stipitatus ATCC 10500]|uniref:Cytochrome P450, putative n=1 Tax=Talaromyces stipitatus (strain ATCC 10500 / CBS 375.48 / QM 6759 / NRRL 1006) TaxID=441959 RepID=B8MV10_TALSN|nr:cytochrome P450, putative [Talaromyces stipitatus ATCC 10500]EED11900.1 cytochrome P450, putative [Talaromyces stipitatus ATCC 10500]